LFAAIASKTLADLISSVRSIVPYSLCLPILPFDIEQYKTRTCDHHRFIMFVLPLYCSSASQTCKTLASAFQMHIRQSDEGEQSEEQDAQLKEPDKRMAAEVVVVAVVEQKVGGINLADGFVLVIFVQGDVDNTYLVFNNLVMHSSNSTH
jgi:hypothetical protein